MFQKFTPEDVERMKAVLQFHPQGDELAYVLSDMMATQDLANQLKYPINTFHDLVKQLGDDKVLQFGEDKIMVKDLRSKVRAFYFPIASPEDFMDKAAELIKENRWGVKTILEEPELGQGQLLPPNQAPALPEEILRLKAPTDIPRDRFVGFTKDEIDRKLSGGG